MKFATAAIFSIARAVNVSSRHLCLSKSHVSCRKNVITYRWEVSQRSGTSSILLVIWKSLAECFSPSSTWHRTQLSNIFISKSDVSIVSFHIFQIIFRVFPIFFSKRLGAKSIILPAKLQFLRMLHRVDICCHRFRRVFYSLSRLKHCFILNC